MKIHFVKGRIITGIYLTAVMLSLSGCKKDTDIIENIVPVADAGLSATVTLPGNSVTLTGTGTDADGHIVAYLWSQVSGPDASNMVNPGSPSTEVRNFIKGTYLFQLMVTDDKGATGRDTVSLIVNLPPIQTATFQPLNNPNELEVTLHNGANETFTGPEISIDAWTSGGEWILRNIFKFNLNTIPANATIISANLYLYSHPTPSTGNLVDANFGTNNSMFLQQITSAWDPATVGWFNQPATSTLNQINIATTTQPLLDLNIDVTNMVKSMVNNSANYGFLLKLQNEVIYNSRIFISSFNTTYPLKHPKLVVVYQ